MSTMHTTIRLGALAWLAFASAAAAQDATEEAAPELTTTVATPEQAAQEAGRRDAGLEELGARIRAREEVATIHRAFGIATWAAMATTAVFGWIQFADEYGFHGNATETACANGNAVFQDFCTGFPWAHAIAGFTTTALYFTTATISFFMPAPAGPSADVELHKTLRWVHFATMIATSLFGLITANIEADFQTRQALALVHQGLGVATFGLLTTAAAIVVF